RRQEGRGRRQGGDPSLGWVLRWLRQTAWAFEGESALEFADHLPAVQSQTGQHLGIDADVIALALHLLLLRTVRAGEEDADLPSSRAHRAVFPLRHGSASLGWVAVGQDAGQAQRLLHRWLGERRVRAPTQ